MTSNYLLFGFAFLATIVLSYLQWKKDGNVTSRQEKLRNNLVFSFTLIAAAIVLISGIVQAIGQRESEKKAEKYQKAFEKSQTTQIQLQNKTLDSTKKILYLYKRLDSTNLKLNKANEEIQFLSRKTVNQTTDILNDSKKVIKAQQNAVKLAIGSGIPEVSVFYQGKNTFGFNFYNKSGFPIYDIQAQLLDMNQIKKCLKAFVNSKDTLVYDVDCVMKSLKTEGPYLLAPGYGSFTLQHSITSKNKIQNLMVSLLCRHDVYVYDFAIQTIPEKRYFVKIYRLEHGVKHLLTQIDYGLKVDKNYWKENFLPENTVLFYMPVREMLSTGQH